MGDSITECSTLRSRVSQLETTIEKLRVELEDAHERNRLVGDYNRELLLKLAALDALDTAPTTTFVQTNMARSQSWTCLAAEGRVPCARSVSANSENSKGGEEFSGGPQLCTPPASEGRTSLEQGVKCASCSASTDDRIIYLHTHDGSKVPGVVQATQEGLAFGSLCGLVKPQEVIGMRTCHPLHQVGSDKALSRKIMHSYALGSHATEPPREKRTTRLYNAIFGAASSSASSVSSLHRSSSIGSLPRHAQVSESRPDPQTPDAAQSSPTITGYGLRGSFSMPLHKHFAAAVATLHPPTGPPPPAPSALCRSTTSTAVDNEFVDANAPQVAPAGGKVQSGVKVQSGGKDPISNGEYDFSVSDEEADSTVADEVSLVGSWEIVWKEGGGEGPLRRLMFEGCVAGYTYIRNVLDAWSTSATVRTVPGGTPEDKGSPSPGKVPLGLKDTGVPLDGRSPYLPICSHPSQLLVSDEQLRGLAGAMPPRYRHSKWTLLYSTWRDGISLGTLLRMPDRIKQPERSPGILVVKDSNGYVFGGFTTEAWRVSSRYFGTGESFVFQVYPRMVMYRWSKLNQYFQFVTGDALALGGGGHFGLWLDSELACGNSGRCDTFRSPCLASSNEFKVHSVELWGITG